MTMLYHPDTLTDLRRLEHDRNGAPLAWTRRWFLRR